MQEKRIHWYLPDGCVRRMVAATVVAVLSVRFEVVVYLLLAPAGAEKRGRRPLVL